ncbi:cell division cycle protein [Aspergillus sp. HF37]|nr:cell division cycle protein [Aspergillus sp. HF37]
MPFMGEQPQTDSADQPQGLPFPPVTHSHILHCSYHHWLPLYRNLTPKSRVIPLSPSFVDYLHADGIILPAEDNIPREDDDLDDFSDEEEDQPDPSAEWPEVQTQVKNTIVEFGGKVTPKLNWSAPKDATWMSATNDLQCTSANDIYLLLKSSDFVTHDLEHAFDGCIPDNDSSVAQPEIPYHLVLRKFVNFNPALEFRCFVRNRVLLCMCQRDQNHFDFLFPIRDSLRSRIQSFFDEKLRDTFPDPNFVFDVYVPPPHQRVWLVDVNPWAERTDPLLFSWLEILNMKDPVNEDHYRELLEGGFVRLSFNGNGDAPSQPVEVDESDTESESDADSQADDAGPFLPEFRLIRRDDPEAYAFSTPQYSAHKLPREVVDASLSGPGGMREFMGQWQDILARSADEQVASSSDDE